MRPSHCIASLAFLYAIAASTTVDTDIVPEFNEDMLSELLPEDSVDDLLAEAKETITKMTASGKREKDCRKLVTDSRKQVIDAVDQCKKTMEALPKGESCAASGQESVKLSTEAKAKADKHVVYTKTEVTKAEETQVHFKSMLFSDLTEGKCSSFYSSTSYTTAKLKYKTAETAHTTAVGAAKAASTSLKLAIEAAAKAKKECECKVQFDHESALAKHSAANAANQKAWTFACKVECVLDHKTSCKCSAAPMCKRAKLTPAVMEASCRKDTYLGCNGWSPKTGTFKGQGGSCDKHGWSTKWCYASKDYSGPGHEFIKPSEVYKGKFYMPCRGSPKDSTATKAKAQKQEVKVVAPRKVPEKLLRRL